MSIPVVIYSPEGQSSGIDFARGALKLRGEKRSFVVFSDSRDVSSLNGLRLGGCQVYFLWMRPHPFTPPAVRETLDNLGSRGARVIVVTDW